MKITLIYAGLLTFSLSLIYVIVFTLPTISLFSYHPLLLLVALITTTEGIATLQRKKIVTEQQASYHGILQGVGFTGMTFGFSVIYYNKDLNSKPHFTTVHGQLGSVTFTFMLIQVIIGTCIVYIPSLFGGVQRAKQLYKYHRLSGYILFLLLWITAYTGITTPFLLTIQGFHFIHLISISSIILGITLSLQGRKLSFKKLLKA